MRSPQEKFMAELERLAGARNLELLVAYSYSNCGRLYLQPPGKFETVLETHFDFQGGRLSLGAQAAKPADPALFPGRPNPKFALFDPHEYGEAIQALIRVAVDAKKAAAA